MNQEGDLFGRKRLADTFEACKEIGIHEAVERIDHELTDHCAGHPQGDDLTLLAFEVADSRVVERVDE